MSRMLRLLTCLLLASPSLAPAYEPIPRRIPPAGQEIPEETRAKLAAQLASLRQKAAGLSRHPLLPDAEIHLKAVDLALEFGEFYDPKKDVAKAGRALEAARRRLDHLTEGASPWTSQRDLVVRGYRSSIDHSAQPYGLEIPETLDLTGKPVPLYVWLHGRGDKITDLHFLDQRATKHWQFKGHLDDGIVLHPFGRQCIGYKSAGEIDVLEAVEHVLANYNVDRDRIALMGFSMGGAGAWHLGAHYADKWAVVHAGAGFVDVQRYQKLGPDRLPPAIEQKLWGLYDVPAYARNLLNVPVVAYSGEKDKQKDAADFMEEVLASHGKDLTHILGKDMGHKYDPASLEKVASFIRQALAQPKDRDPDVIHFQTRTLRYPRYAWLEVAALREHWHDTRVDAEFAEPAKLRILTRNALALRIHRPLPAGCTIRIDDSDLTLAADQAATDLHRTDDGKWMLGPFPAPKPRKEAGLQGPIDDAFLGPVLVVTPGGTSANPKLDAWVAFELAHLETRWRALFRGGLRTIPSTELTPELAARHNLVLFGTPESNDALRKALQVTALEWPAGSNQALVGIHPNPHAPGRYLVVNSGPTFREAHDRTNSLQNPKLGDWAVIDLSEPPGPERPGKIVKSGFFDEQWRRR